MIVTAFDEHAIQAFEAGAIDYLLKPVGEARLRRPSNAPTALMGQARMKSQLTSTRSHPPQIPSALRSRKIVGRNGEEYFILSTRTILAFQAERELVWIITAKQRLLATQTLRAHRGAPGDPQFQRVHRNAIVNVNHIRKMSALSSQRWLITLSNSLQIIVSKRQAHNIRKILHW